MLDNPEYMKKALRKIREYEENGIFPGDRLIVTCESSTDQLDIDEVERMISFYF